MTALAIILAAGFGLNMAMAATLYMDGDADYRLYLGSGVILLGLAFMVVA